MALLERIDSEDEQMVVTKLGKTGLHRWECFRKGFSGGRGGHPQQALSPESEGMLLAALRIIEFPRDVVPSLFLTDEGFFELAWKDEKGLAIQLELGSRESEIYVEGTGVEFTFPNEKLAVVLSEILLLIRTHIFTPQP